MDSIEIYHRPFFNPFSLNSQSVSHDFIVVYLTAKFSHKNSKKYILNDLEGYVIFEQTIFSKIECKSTTFFSHIS